MKTLKNLMFLLILLATLSSWKAKSSNFRESGNIIGRWSKDAGIIWEIKSDGTYSLTFSGGNSVGGKYKLKDNQITLIDDNSAGNAVNCSPGQKGVYTFLVEINVLTLTKVNDPCEGRDLMVQGSYSRQD